jgi:hypothetical protein
MTIDNYIEQRNDIQLRAEGVGKELADKCWVELGVANRHINRVIDEELPLSIVEDEIQKCFYRVKRELFCEVPNANNPR